MFWVRSAIDLTEKYEKNPEIETEVFLTENMSTFLRARWSWTSVSTTKHECILYKK